MRFKELSRAEQAVVRRITFDRLRSTAYRQYPHVSKVLANETDQPGVGPALVGEVRTLWTALEDAWRSDFDVPTDIVSLVEQQRSSGRALDEEFADVSDDPNDRRHLTRRIHNQRVALRDCQRLLAWAWKRANEDWLRQKQWDKTHSEWLADDEELETSDPKELAELVRRQRRALRRAARLIDEQQQEMSRLLDRAVRAASRG